MENITQVIYCDFRLTKCSSRFSFIFTLPLTYASVLWLFAWGVCDFNLDNLYFELWALLSVFGLLLQNNMPLQWISHTHSIFQRRFWISPYFLFFFISDIFVQCSQFCCQWGEAAIFPIFEYDWLMKYYFSYMLINYIFIYLRLPASVLSSTIFWCFHFPLLMLI